MLVSCKISNSLLIFLERERADVDFVYECFDGPDEFIRDPSYWISAEKMEEFLQRALQSYEDQSGADNFLERVGHECFSLRAWGVLDSVLRMMGDPLDIFNQPARFLSYFLSPDPEVNNVVRGEHNVAFEVGLSSEQYPLITQFLRYSFEALPQYVGRDCAKVSWQGQHFQISWSQNQEELKLESQSAPNLSPDLLQSIVQSLQESQRALESKNKELAEMNEILQKRAEPTATESVDRKEAQILSGHIYKLSDYFTRANQLITLLIGQDRMDRQVKEAMRRVDWEYTQSQFPKVIDESLEMIRKLPKSSPTSSLGQQSVSRPHEGP